MLFEHKNGQESDPVVAIGLPAPVLKNLDCPDGNARKADAFIVLPLLHHVRFTPVATILLKLRPVRTHETELIFNREDVFYEALANEREVIRREQHETGSHVSLTEQVEVVQVDRVPPFTATPDEPLYREWKLFEVLGVWSGDVVGVVLEEDFAVVFSAATIFQAVEESADVTVGIAVDSRSQDQADQWVSSSRTSNTPG